MKISGRPRTIPTGMGISPCALEMIIMHTRAQAAAETAPDLYMTRGEAAGYLKLSVSYLAKLAVIGGGPVMCRMGRAVRYRRRDLDAWAAVGTCHSTSEVA